MPIPFLGDDLPARGNAARRRRSCPRGYQGIQRFETLPVPEAALREAVLNAIIHKDYSSGTPFQISVYPDKLMLWNPGELPLDWTVAKLKGKHPLQPFNPDVANAFFRAGMIEAWGRGIERILEACRIASTPEPRLRYEPSGLWVEFSFPALRPDQPHCGCVDDPARRTTFFRRRGSLLNRAT